MMQNNKKKLAQEVNGAYDMCTKRNITIKQTFNVNLLHHTYNDDGHTHMP